MNNELIVSSIGATASFLQSHETYFQYITQLGKENEIRPTDYLEIREQSKKRLEELDKLKKEMSKLENFLHPVTYKILMSSIENEKILAGTLQSDCEQFLETQEKKFEESVLTGLQYENELSMSLIQSLSTVERQMGIMIVGSVMNQKMTLEEVSELSSSLEKGTPFQMQIEDLENYMKRSIQAETSMNISDEKEDKKEEGDVSSNSSEEEKKETAATKKAEPTLADKIAEIQFSENKNMVAEVQELTVEDRMAQIAGILASLSGKEKLTLRDMIQIHTLQEEQVQLEAYVASLAEQKLSRSQVRRNKKMELVNEKIEQNKKNFETSLENSQHYNSKIMRFFSARYQEQLSNQVEMLRAKRGVLQQNQKASALAKFNKKSGRIVRSSKVLGTIKGMSQFKNAKIEELRALREQVVTELQNFQQDFNRFTSEKNLLPQLKQSTVIMPDRMMSVEEHKLQAATLGV